MSDTILKLIPENPGFNVAEADQKEIEKLLLEIFEGSQVEISESETVEFIDSGSNFESIKCNLCDSSIDFETWQNAMDNAHQTAFENLTFTTACCEKRSSLNELHYNWPCGFSKITFTILDPKVELTSNQLEQIERVGKISFRKIWAHY